MSAHRLVHDLAGVGSFRQIAQKTGFGQKSATASNRPFSILAIVLVVMWVMHVKVCIDCWWFGDIRSCVWSGRMFC